MKNKTRLWMGITALLLIALGAYFLANAVMDSLMNFRSPLAGDPPLAGDASGSALSRRVVVVLVDALREDTSLDVQVMPYLNKLRQNAAVATMHSQPPSYSDPGWATVLSGAWPDINDSQPANPPDDDSVRTFTQDDIFAAADRAGIKTAVSGFSWFEQMLANSGVDEGFYTPGEDSAADMDVLGAAVPWLQDAQYQLVLIHLDQVDYAGHHQGGPLGEDWAAAARRVDAMLQTITAGLDLEKDTLLVISDHGQIDAGGHGGTEPITMLEPFVMLGAGVVPGQYADIEMVDIAPTLAALLGTSIPASNQGRALTEMLAFTGEQEEAFNELQQLQQEQLLQKYQTAMGVDGFQVDGTGSAATAMQTIRSQRLARERIFRLVVTVLLVLLPGYFIYRKKDRNLPKYGLGALVAILVFHLLYAVVQGNTYTLSSMADANAFILCAAQDMGIGLLIGWLVSMLWVKGFREGSRTAAQTSIDFLFILLYMLFLPILWNLYRNGILITWTLPEFGSMFIGFLSILQSMFVAVFGLLLTGLSALVAGVKKKA
ncbi:MAG: PglZ domain-containing protein [Pelolinea sp.]|jgi:hypothetical protein|nr:PglZ domain-containing protein [Pelolinea sp.]